MHEWKVYAGVALLVGLAWLVSLFRPFEAGDDTGYWVGVAGGSMMLLLFLYPLRKHFRFAQQWGHMRWWFYLHMTLGLGGPWLILVHSTFRVGSLNGAVALYSMLIVAASGIVGRFIYRHVHKGLRGEETTLVQLQTFAGMHKSDARSRLWWAQEVVDLLKGFEEQQLRANPNWKTSLRQVTWLPVERRRVEHKCSRALRGPVHQRAKAANMTRDEERRLHHKAMNLVRSYLDAVVGVAQFTAYERVFALWHVAHIPFVYLMVITATVHVIAVHMY